MGGDSQALSLGLALRALERGRRREVAGRDRVTLQGVVAREPDHAPRDDRDDERRGRNEHEPAPFEAGEKGSAGRAPGRSARGRARARRWVPRASSRGSRSAAGQTCTLTFSSSFFRARDSRVETAVGRCRARARPPRRRGRAGRGARSPRARPRTARGAPPRALGQSRGTVPRRRAPGTAARSSRFCRRSSARNQSSAVVRAIWIATCRALARRGSNRRHSRSAFSNVSAVRSSASERSRVR